MDALGNGLILIFNGLLTLVGWASSWTVLLGALLLISLAFLASVEVSILDNATAKPDVELH